MSLKRSSPPRIGRFLAVLMVLATVSIWSFSFVLINRLLREVPPVTLTTVRFLIAFVTLEVLRVITGQSVLPKLTPKEWGLLAASGLLTYTFGNTAAIWSQLYLPPVTVAFLFNFIPVFVILMGIFALREIPSAIQWIGTGIMIIGAYMFFSAPKAFSPVWAVLLVISADIGFAAFSIIGRPFARDDSIDTLTLSAIPMGIGSIALIPIAASLEGMPHFSIHAIYGLLFLGMVTSALAYWLWNKALGVLKAFEVNTLANLVPFGTALTSWIWLGQGISLIQIVGMTVSIFGISLVGLGGNEETPESPMLHTD